MIKQLQNDLYLVQDERVIKNNSYILVNDNDCLIIDPSFETNEIIQLINKHKWNVVGILLTHAHYDHICGVNKITNVFNCNIYCSINEKDILQNHHLAEEFNVHNFKNNRKKIIYFEKNHLVINNFNINIIASPGHTPGSVTYLYKNYLFVGDTIFNDSIGRTDLYKGNSNDIFSSIKKIMKLINDENYILTGHNDTGLKYKQIKKINPYIIHFINNK